MQTLSKDYLLGYLAGVINGISLRHDVPEEVRKSCREVYKKYQKETEEAK